MEITAAASAPTLTQAQILEQAGTGVMRKMLDLQAQQGAELAAMIAQAGGLGRNLDVTA